VLDGFSAHADQAGLVSFPEAVDRAGSLRQVLLVHGEPPAQTALAARLADHGFKNISAPAPGERVVLG